MGKSYVNGEEDKAYLLGKRPLATPDEIFLFKDKVGYLVGMCGYDDQRARDQAYGEYFNEESQC
jgi:hypothetical protein